MRTICLTDGTCVTVNENSLLPTNKSNSEGLSYREILKEESEKNILYPANQFKKIRLGDVTGDGKLTKEDIQLIADHTDGIISLTKEGMELADMNQDGVVNDDDFEKVWANYLRGAREPVYTSVHISNINRYTPKNSDRLGDVNNDGIVSLTDVSRLALHVDGSLELSKEELANADVNSDGVVDEYDVNALTKNYLCRSQTKGDVDGDGKISQSDWDILVGNLSGHYVRGYNHYNADVNQDGIIDMKDARAIKNITQNTIMGDANNDGVVDTKDYAVMRDYLENIRSDVPNKNAADMDLDGKITNDDILKLIDMPQFKNIPYIPGDVNADGVVDHADICDLSNYLYKQISNHALFDNADMNKDGKLDFDDVAMIKNIVEPPKPVYNYPANAVRTVPAYEDAAKTRQVNSYERVDAGDVIKVLEVDSANNSLKVEYPTKSGNKIRWVDASVFEPEPTPEPESAPIYPTNAVRTVPAYEDAAKTRQVNKYERVDAGDYVKVLEEDKANHSIKVEYPTKSGTKVRWVDASIFESQNGVLSVPLYHQYGESWSNTKIGTKTIGAVGCLICSLAMKYEYEKGIKTDPGTMRNKLSFSNNALYWSSLNGLGFTRTTSYGSSVNSAMLRFIYDRLLEGKPVIIGGQKNSEGDNQHWVTITGYTGDPNNLSADSFLVNDPGKAGAKTLQQFLNNNHSVIKGLIY